ncbi:ribonuclease P/MRP protein subunit POP1 [Ceratobasidium sp. AG-Ba]|nr:ribonuclease P/MRP protein subunit POP1 [Ceratobasidium sp. AG-Ba]QRW15171.1 ribonuclease P/MRP protein subunit POP1 [Ceratobasidium sp. AG-Ba]
MFKKQKTEAARQIHVEPPPGLPLNSAEGLPATVDIERFAEARSFEIGAMHSAIKNAASTTTHRVWQTLPRHLRRRAASHDVRRVPVRLRDKAKQEIDPVKRRSFLKLLKRKKRLGRNSKRSEKFANRQKNKAWLETHLWHAKRMHMQDKWGYRLAVRPTEKSYRPSHRAAVHGSTLHDASYMSTIELSGPMEALISTLKRCCDPCGAGPWSTRYVSGVRMCSTYLYELDSWPAGLISPITVLWRPTEKLRLPDGSGLSSPGQPDLLESKNRVLWIRVHPASLKSAMESLRSARELVSPASQLEIADLSGDINAFELVGPRTSQVIHGAFRLAERGPKFWDSLANARSSGNFSPGMIVGMTIHDPRLNFPPTNAKVGDTTDSNFEFVSPSPVLAQSSLWDQDARDKLRSPTFKKAALDKRRSANLVPGTRLRPTKEDDQIPIILIQHTVSANLGDNSRDSQPMHGWTILLPPSWSMAFLNSLAYTGTRVVGLAARHHQRLEVSCPHFPEDYIGVPAFVDHSTSQAALERAKWERTPKGKRVNYESLGVESPWASDWPGLVGGSIQTGDLIPADRSARSSDDRKPWLLLSPNATQLIKHFMDNHASDSMTIFREWINSQRTRRDMPGLDQNLTEKLFDSALVHVRFDMLGRGKPQDRAIVYGFSTHEVGQKWRADLDRLESGDAKNEVSFCTNCLEQDDERVAFTVRRYSVG